MTDAWMKIFKESPLFETISPEDTKELLACFTPRIIGYRRNEIISHEGDVQDSIGFLLSGKISINRENINGNKLILSILHPADLFGELTAFTGRGKWPATIISVEASEVMFIPIRKFSVTCANSCESHSQLIRNMLGIISGKAMVLNQKVEYLTIKGMREKLSAFLIEQYRQTGNTTFTINMNRNELADFLNVSRPSMSREMGRMKDEGLIDFYRSSIRITDLESLARNCSSPIH